MLQLPYSWCDDWFEPECIGHDYDGQGETFGSLAFENGQKEWPVRAYKPGDWEVHKPEYIGAPPVEQFQYRQGY